ncbi:hypothetical protein HanRHA438_Chr15g0699671 [Helianthus annuus]|uniref:Uncharacterized protein n=1 Tax=Helianthus annuus TaxID=4232 RepID=A0A251S7Q5_HELAN|nr:hypothetical protein HanXRQr2_Chr15g0687401 [Helianthus annuus]KAJ0450783.1 hypothetical protein HanHA300_Chr15g0560121 [Helianthus annuus]KAJ0455062.1 hypothetical protein HanIR_Chr15g0746961 [Helianthus annuus]KAJ0472631.1 hypothetical protein HanHA89_Chr15g0609221 [Helianthus annuus]KAJ0648234.1 hypothetical protein HanLR1_Chr15g0570601 [Helianthus annuus]
MPDQFKKITLGIRQTTEQLQRERKGVRHRRERESGVGESERATNVCDGTGVDGDGDVSSEAAMALTVTTVKWLGFRSSSGIFSEDTNRITR